MSTTIFLAQIWGPIILAIGIGLFVSRNFYTRVYREIQKEPFAALLFGMLAMAVGIMQISMHNLWNNLTQSVISLLGWGTLLKGALFVIAPHTADRMSDWAQKKNILPFAGALLVIGGALLSWVGYISF